MFARLSDGDGGGTRSVDAPLRGPVARSHRESHGSSFGVEAKTPSTDSTRREHGLAKIVSPASIRRRTPTKAFRRLDGSFSRTRTATDVLHPGIVRCGGQRRHGAGAHRTNPDVQHFS